MKYFRHFSNASSSLKIQTLIRELGVEGYGQYFLLLELLNEKFDGETTKIQLHFDEISAKVRIKFTKKLELFIQKLSDFSLLSFEKQKEVYQINCPILLELMDKDSKYNRKKRKPSDVHATLELEVDIDIDKEVDIYKPSTIFDNSTSSKITPDKIIDLFNSKFNGIGKMKLTPSFGLPRSVLDDFKITLGFIDFQKIEYWENYFDLVSKSKFLTTQLTPTIAWLFKSENAFKVLGGQYQDHDKNEPDEDYKKDMAALAAKYAEVV